MTNPSVKYPDSLLKFLTQSQLEVVSKLFQKDDLSKISIEKELSKIILPARGIFNKTLNYNDILERLCRKFEINISPKNSIQEKEEKILLHKFQSIIENLTPEEKLKLENEIKDYTIKMGLNTTQVVSLNTLSTLTIANLSGFGLYIMASTIVGGLTSILGISLSFAFYTGMSSAISVIIGPVGWAIGLGFLAYSFRNDNLEGAKEKVINYSKGIKNSLIGNSEHALLTVSFLASSRIILKEENIKEQEELLKTKKSIDEKTQNLSKANRNMEAQIIEYQKNISTNSQEIEKLSNESYETEIKINKIKNFINQTNF